MQAEVRTTDVVVVGPGIVSQPAKATVIASQDSAPEELVDDLAEAFDVERDSLTDVTITEWTHRDHRPNSMEGAESSGRSAADAAMNTVMKGEE